MTRNTVLTDKSGNPLAPATTAEQVAYDNEKNVKQVIDDKATKQEVDVERKRIDTFTSLPDGATTGDAELADIRVAADGKKYNTAGEAVRAQANAAVKTQQGIRYAGKCLTVGSDGNLYPSITPPAIYLPAKGEFITTTDSTAYPLGDIKLYGRSIQDGEPSPDTPIPIVSVGEYNEETEKYEVGITITNKNLASDINVYSGYYYDVDGAPSPADSRFVRVSMIKIFPGVRYAISSNLNIYSITMYDNNRKKVSFATAPINQKTFVINPGKKVTYLGVSLHNTSGAEDTSAFEFLQVETGTKASPYVAGERKNITLSLSEPLRGIPVDSGGNYTDAKGQKFLGDVADKQKSKIYRGCGSKTFNGSETWFADTSNHIYTYITSDAKMYPSNALCDSYVFKHDATQLGQSDFGFAIVSPYYIRFKNVNVQSLDDWKSMLQTRPITIVYPLATPTEESLTPDQLAALNLSTYEGVTNIGTDSNAGIEIRYGVDTQTYINNKIAELTENLSLMQSTVPEET